MAFIIMCMWWRRLEEPKGNFYGNIDVVRGCMRRLKEHSSFCLRKEQI